MSPKLLNLLLIIGTFALYYIIISPLYSGGGSLWSPQQSITTLKDVNRQYDQTIEQVESLFNEAEALKNQYSSISQDALDKMKVMVPSSVDPVRLVSEVESIANQSGHTLRDLSYSEAPLTDPQYGSYAINFSIKTSYMKFKELMDYYEKSLRIYNLQYANFAVSPADLNSATYQVRLVTYYIK